MSMYRKPPRVLIALALLLSSTPVLGLDPLALEFDDRRWQIGHESVCGGMHIVEFVLEGESVCCWSELVTWQFFEGLQVRDSPRELMRQIRHRRMISSPLVRWRIHSESFDSVLFSWSLENDPLFGSYFQLTRIVKSEEGLLLLHYATVNRATFAAHVDAWSERFEDYEVPW